MLHFCQLGEEPELFFHLSDVFALDDLYDGFFENREICHGLQVRARSRFLSSSL